MTQSAERARACGKERPTRANPAVGTRPGLSGGQPATENDRSGRRVPQVATPRGHGTVPFAETIDSARKYVVSDTLDRVDWNAELVQGDLEKAVQQLKTEPGEGLFVGGMTLPLALADLELIDECEFVVHPVVVGHGPTLFAGLGERLELELVERTELGSGAVALRYQASRVAP